MQRRLLMAFVWFGALFFLGIARAVWLALRYVTTDIRRIVFLGGVALAVWMTDFSRLHLVPQIEMPSHPVMAASVAGGVLLVLSLGLSSPWARALRRRLGGR